MEFKKEFLIRGLLIFSGISLILFSIFNFWLNLSPIIDTFISNGFNSLNSINSNLDKSLLRDLIIFIFLGFLLFEIGVKWKDIFKIFTKWAISFGIFFLSISIFLFPIYHNSNNIVNSIQPSIDDFLVNSLDSILSNIENKTINDSKSFKNQISLELYDNFKIYNINVENITLNQSNLILDSINLNIKSEDKKILISKILISSTFVQLNSLNSNFTKLIIPIDVLKKTGIKDLDINIINQIPLEILKENFQINPSANLNLLFSNSSIKKDIIISNITNSDAELIWKNLNLKGNFSLKSKKEFEKFIFIYLNKNLDSFNNYLNLNEGIPIIMISNFIPENFKKLTNYDILTSNLTLRKNNFIMLRNDCISEKLDFPMVCNLIKLTSYDELMLNLTKRFNSSNIRSDNLNLNSNSNPKSFNLNFLNISKINSLSKLNNEIENKTSVWIKYFIYFIISFVLAIIFYILNFKLFKRELINIHIYYHISKLNFYNYIWYFIFYILFYIIFSLDFILNFLNGFLDIEKYNLLVLILNLPLFKELFEINKEIFYLSLFYFIISLFFYLTFYFLQKKKLENYYEKLE